MSLSIEQILPIYKIENDLIIGKNGDYTIGIEIILPEEFSLNKDKMESMHGNFLKALKELPDHSVYHKQDYYLKEDYNHEVKENETFIEKSVRFDLFEKKIFKHYSYIFLSLTDYEPKNRSSLGTILSKKGLLSKSHISEDKIEDFLDSVRRFVALIKSEGIKVRMLKKEDYTDHLLPFYFSLEATADITNEVDFIEGKVGRNYTKLYSIEDKENLPNEIDVTQIDKRFSSELQDFNRSFTYSLGFDVPYNHMVNHMVYLDDAKQIELDLQSRVKKMKKFKSLSFGNESVTDEMTEVLKEEVAKGNEICRSHFNIMAWTDNPLYISDLDNAVINAFNVINLRPKLAGAEDFGNLYLSSCPGNGSDMPTEKTFFVPCTQALCFTNYVTNYKADNKGLLFYDRRNNPLTLDLFYKPYDLKIINNRNELIFGIPGAGKSFTVNYKIRQELEMGYHIILVDLGDSYKKLCKLLGGKYIENTDDTPISLNPFLGEFDDDKVIFLPAMVYVLWEKPESAEITQTLINILDAYYLKMEKIKGFKCFTTFYDYVKNNQEKLKNDYFDINSFLLVLEPYAYGRFQHLFNAKENIDLYDDRFVVFELSGIKDNKKLFKVTNFLIVELSRKKIKYLKGIPKRLIMEEAWIAFDDPVLIQYLKEFNKTSRKETGGLTIVTQNVQDLTETPIGQVVIDNSPIKILLNNKADTGIMLTLKKALGLSDHAVSLLQSLEKDMPNRWNEGLFIIGSMLKVLRIKVNAIELTMFTSDKDDNVKIYDEIERVGSVEQGIINYSKKFE